MRHWLLLKRSAQDVVVDPVGWDPKHAFCAGWSVERDPVAPFLPSVVRMGVPSKIFLPIEPLVPFQVIPLDVVLDGVQRSLG